MPLSVSITEDDIFTALRAFLLLILPGNVEVIQGQVNRVAEPTVPDFIVMSMKGKVRLATNTGTWDQAAPAPTTLAITQPTQVTVQLDVHGDNGGDYCQLIETMMRDYYGVDNAANPGVVPLYAQDPIQAPFVNGEGQYEDRWVLPVVLQVTPSIVTPQAFMDILTVSIANSKAA